VPIFLLTDELVFPHPSLSDITGLLAVGGDLSVDRLLLAYSNGIFPWPFEDEPIYWFSPDPRAIVYPSQVKISKSLQTTINKQKFTVKFDTCFSDVINKCATIKRDEANGTWIREDMLHAYNNLHKAGFAHSVEIFFNNELVGGLYGVSLGGIFFGESMFHTKTDASKVAFVALCKRLTDWNFDLIDAQITTSHLKTLGAIEIDRQQFLEIIVRSLQKETRKGLWTEK